MVADSDRWSLIRSFLYYIIYTACLRWYLSLRMSTGFSFQHAAELHLQDSLQGCLIQCGSLQGFTRFDCSTERHTRRDRPSPDHPAPSAGCLSLSYAEPPSTGRSMRKGKPSCCNAQNTSGLLDALIDSHRLSLLSVCLF